MEYKLSDYVALFFSQRGIRNVFSVVGGGSMHLNDSFANCKKMRCIYNHHEQASAMAAEGFAKTSGLPAITCVTTGPGGTNAITGVLCAWQDSVPMIVISGQVRCSTTVESTGLPLRQFGEQEHSIVDTVRNITKYAFMVTKPNEIKFHLEKALYEATTGRRGPCWIDLPLDIQSAIICEEEMPTFNPTTPSKLANDCLDIIDEIKAASSPVIIVGSSLRRTGCLDIFYELAGKLNIPIVCTTCTADYFTEEHPLYFGNFGVLGGRTGNFLVQNADLLVCLGARMSFLQIGFNYEKFSPNSKKIVIDIDIAELQKPTLKINRVINADIHEVITALNKHLISPLLPHAEWLRYANSLKTNFHRREQPYASSHLVNPYHFGNRLFEKLEEDGCVVVANSVSAVMLTQLGISKKGQRIIGNVNCGPMGYDLPAAIGAAVARHKPVICVSGDGSFQMNIQELQTIIHNNLPVKIVICNNGGYQGVVATQKKFFSGRIAGCTAETGVGFPSLEKIAYAYDIPYAKATTNTQVDESIEWLLSQESFCLLELIIDTNQAMDPRVMSKKATDGTIYSPPLDDLSPFLSKEEYEKYRDFNTWKKSCPHA